MKRFDAPDREGWFMVGDRGFFDTGKQVPVVKVSYEILSLHHNSAEAMQVCASVDECESCGRVAPLQPVSYPDTTFRVCEDCAPCQGVLL